MQQLCRVVPLVQGFRLVETLVALEPNQLALEHRRDVDTRRTRFRLRKAEDRAHILEGFKIALRNLDDFVKIIRAASNRDEARVKLMAKYGLSERQAVAILDLRLYQLTGLEREKIEEEWAVFF